MTALSAPVTTRLTPDEKDAFAANCENIGTSPATAIRMFIKAFNKRKGFPFDPNNPLGFNMDTLRAMDDAVSGTGLAGPFESVDDLIASLEE